MIDAWAAALPLSVTTAAASLNSGVHAGAVIGATRISPDWSASKSAGPRTTRTGPVARPGEAGEPLTMASSDRAAPTRPGNDAHRRDRTGPRRPTISGGTSCA